MDALRMIPLTMTTMKAAAAAGTTTTYSTTGTTLFCIKGKAYSKAAATNAATPTTDATTGSAFVAIQPGYGSVFVLGYDSAGALKVSQGTIQALDGSVTTDSAGFITSPQFPAVPDSICPFAYLVTKVGSAGSAWTFGSSNLAGPPSNVSHKFVDVMTLPDRPQVA